MSVQAIGTDAMDVRFVTGEAYEVSGARAPCAGRPAGRRRRR